MAESPIVDVYVAQNAPQAHFLKNLLDDAGIEAEVTGAEVPFTDGPHLRVRAADAERARQLLEKWEQDRRSRQADE